MSFDYSWRTVLFLISVRLDTLLLFPPIQAIRQLPIMIQLFFIFILSFLLSHTITDYPSLNKVLFEQLSIKKNTQMALGGFYIKTDHGSFDASIEKRIDNLKVYLKQIQQGENHAAEG